jgi:hypothetical protein
LSDPVVKCGPSDLDEALARYEESGGLLSRSTDEAVLALDGNISPFELLSHGQLVESMR